MPIVASGSSVSVTIPANGVLTIAQGYGVGLLLRGTTFAAGSQNIAIENGDVIGPFDIETILYLSARSVLSYSIGDVAKSLVTAKQADSLAVGQVIQRLCRPFWLAYRSWMLALNPPVANTGTVVYIDVGAGSDGAGTVASPRNVDITKANNTTYLYLERTRVVASALLTGMTATGVVLGTYAAGSGERVFDPERLATIDSAVSYNFRCAVRWQGTSGNFAISGLRLIGGNNASGGVQQFESITAPAASIITVEHCVFESMGAYQLVTSQINNQGIAVSGARLVARFNRINVAGDGIAVSPAAGAGFDFLCNEITVSPLLTVGGPDAIQVQRTTTNAIGKWSCRGNWLNQAANTKQAFLIAGGTQQATGEEGIFSRNFCFGTDCASNPPLTPFLTGQIGYVNDSTSVCDVVSNFFDQFTGWASVPSGGRLANNIGIRRHTGEWLVGFGTAAGSSGALVANNTAILLGTTWTGGATNKGIEIAGSGHTVQNNLLVNAGMRLPAGVSESRSIFVGGRPVDLSNVLLSLGAGSAIVEDAKLDAIGRPLIGSPAQTGATTVTFASMVQRFPDVFGNTAFDTDSFAVGAAQGWATA